MRRIRAARAFRPCLCNKSGPFLELAPTGKLPVVRSVRIVFGLIFLMTTLGRGQDVAALLQQGDAAAHADQHGKAIAAYQRALELKPDLRGALLPKLAQQYLWNDNAGKAAELFEEVLRAHPGDCDSRLTYALALSDTNNLPAARQAYSEVAAKCPALATDARLGEARTLRWMDRLTQADALYEALQGSGSADQMREAGAGLAIIQMDRDNNRRARAMFAGLDAAGPADATVEEGEADALLRLGLPDQALALLERPGKSNLHNRSLEDLKDHLLRTDHPALSPEFEIFQDSDGTRFHSDQLTTSLGWRKRTRGELHWGDSNLALGGRTIEGRWLGVAVEHRFNESLSLRAEGRSNDFLQANFRPWTGEFDAVWTPSDRLRVDAAVARLLIADNVASLENHLIGTFLSAGFDERWQGNDTISASLDTTRWSEGNTRMRYRFSLAHSFEGATRFTLIWPTSFQTYDRGFSFGLFSPPFYAETGPGVTLSRRYARYWTVSLNARIGAQKETGDSWHQLGSFGASLERELWKSWAFQSSAGYSSSNLASPSGFTRKSFSLGITRRF